MERYKANKTKRNGKSNGSGTAVVPVDNNALGRKNKQGELPRRGRPPGAENKYNREMRDLIIEAAASVGSDGKGREGTLGYLKRCARKHEVAYLQAMVKLVPHRLHARIDFHGTLEIEYETLEEARAALEREGIIIDQVLSG